MSEQKPVTTKSAAKSSKLEVRTIQRHADWSLVRANDEYRILDKDMVAAHVPEKQRVLPALFAMTSTEWSAAIVPVPVAKRLGFSGALGDSIDLACWRRGRISDDQPFSASIRDAIVTKIGGAINANLDKLEPKPE